MALDVLVPLVASRVLLLLVALLAVALLPLGAFPGTWVVTEYEWIDALSRWDGRWYWSIAEFGYAYWPGEQSNVAFSPLYPMLMKAGAFLLGWEALEGWLLAGIVASNLALVVALAALYALVRLEFDRQTAARAVLYLCIFPSSFFLSAVYADSLYLALAIPAFYQARKGNWPVVGGLGFLAALARPHGVLLVVPLAYEYLAQRGFRWRAARWDILALALIPAGLAAWALYVYRLSGDPLVFVQAQHAWGRELMLPWQTLEQFLANPLVLHGSNWNWSGSLLDLTFTLIFGALAVACWRVVRPSFALYATVVYLVMISSGELVSTMRHGLAIFPAFVVLAVAGRRPTFHQAYLMLAAGLAALLMALFAAGYWVA